jgi:hypothetical protein
LWEWIGDRWLINLLEGRSQFGDLNWGDRIILIFDE